MKRYLTKLITLTKMLCLLLIFLTIFSTGVYSQTTQSTDLAVSLNASKRVVVVGDIVDVIVTVKNNGPSDYVSGGGMLFGFGTGQKFIQINLPTEFRCNILVGQTPPYRCGIPSLRTGQSKSIVFRMKIIGDFKGQNLVAASVGTNTDPNSSNNISTLYFFFLAPPQEPTL